MTRFGSISSEFDLILFLNRYDAEANTARQEADATLIIERYVTVQADGHGEKAAAQGNTPSSGNKIVRKIWHKATAFEDSDVTTWTLAHTFADNTAYIDTIDTFQELLTAATYGSIPLTLAQTWEDVTAAQGPLDIVPGAAAAYSLRLLDSTYTGDAIRVRRASDNTEQDIGFDGSGELDTSALATFCAGTDGFVKTWYDQSGNGNDATQTTTANQPKIYDSSTGVVTENGKAAIEGNGTSTSLRNFTVALSADYFICLVSKLDSAGTNMWLGTTSAGGYFRAVDTGTSITIRHDGETGGADFNVSVGTNQLIHTAQRVATTMHYAQNGSDNTATERATQGASFSVTCLFDGYNNFYEIDGTMQEVVIYNSDKSANRAAIEANINAFYSIY